MVDNPTLSQNVLPTPPVIVQTQPIQPTGDSTEFLKTLSKLRQTNDLPEQNSHIQSEMQTSYLTHKIKALTPSGPGSTPVPASLSSLYERTSLIIEKTLAKVFYGKSNIL